MDLEDLPNEPVVYQVLDRDYPEEIEVYDHPIKGLSCFSEDFDSCGSGVCDETDCHVSVQFTCITFGKRLRD